MRRDSVVRPVLGIGEWDQKNGIYPFGKQGNQFIKPPKYQSLGILGTIKEKIMIEIGPMGNKFK